MLLTIERYVQEPLAEYCLMWTSADGRGNFGYETLCLDLHPLKSMLKGVGIKLLKTLEQVLVDHVCEIGVDLNNSVAHDHLAPMLAFVAGLGLRKADALKQSVRRQLSAVVSRKELIEKKILGKIVYTNCAGFLRISETLGIAKNREIQLDPLDNTRIHPECYITYDFAYKICADALEDTNDDPHNRIPIVKKLMRRCVRTTVTFVTCVQIVTYKSPNPISYINFSETVMHISLYFLNTTNTTSILNL